MKKTEKITQKLVKEIRVGKYGSPGDRFIPVRSIAEQFQVSLSTAQKILHKLKEEKVLTGESTSPTRIADDAILPTAFPSGNTRVLGLVVPDLTNPFFGALCRHAEQCSRMLGYRMLTTSTDSLFEHERQSIEGLLEAGAKGLLIAPGLDERCIENYRSLQNQGIHVVFVSRRPEKFSADFVVAHNLLGGVAVAGHFMDMGYESFGYLGFGAKLKRDGRLIGFRAELLEHGINLPPTHMAMGGGPDIEHGYRAMQSLVKSAGGPPRAIFAYNDLLAIGARHYCRDHGIDVPGEVALVGFDNLPESSVTTPAISSVAYPIESIAQLAIQCVVDRLDAIEQFPPRHILLEPNLIIRASSDPMAKLREYPVMSSENIKLSTSAEVIR